MASRTASSPTRLNVADMRLEQVVPRDEAAGLIQEISERKANPLRRDLTCTLSPSSTTLVAIRRLQPPAGSSASVAEKQRTAKPSPKLGQDLCLLGPFHPRSPARIFSVASHRPAGVRNSQRRPRLPAAAVPSNALDAQPSQARHRLGEVAKDLSDEEGVETAILRGRDISNATNEAVNRTYDEDYAAERARGGIVRGEDFDELLQPATTKSSQLRTNRNEPKSSLRRELLEANVGLVVLHHPAPNENDQNVSRDSGGKCTSATPEAATGSSPRPPGSSPSSPPPSWRPALPPRDE